MANCDDEIKILEFKRNLALTSLTNPALNPFGFALHSYGKKEILPFDPPIVRYQVQQIDKQINELQNKKLSTYPQSNCYINSGLRI